MPSPSLTEVDACVAAGRRDGVFPASIERVFEAQSRAYRARAMRSSIVPAALFYNAFLPAHVLLLPETAPVAAGLHLLVTIWIFAAGEIVRREPRRTMRELVGASVPAAMIVQILAIYVLNTSAAADHYQYLAILGVVYMNVNVRPDFRVARATSILIGLAYAGLLLAGSSGAPVKVVGIGSMASAIALTLAANWRMEMDRRYAFLRRLQDQLRRAQAEVAAGSDALTGLFNRRYLEETAARLWRQDDNTVSPMAVVMLDVDHFKAYNDRYGHPAGDLCLKRVAAAILSELRDEADIAARFGGEEFIVLLPKTDLPTAVQVAERMRRAIETLSIPHEGLPGGGCVTASFGVMAGLVSAHPVAELITGADTALYAAKRSGRNQVWPPFVKAGGGRVSTWAAARTRGAA